MSTFQSGAQPLAADPAPAKSWLPTRKWFALLVTGVATVLGSILVTGEFDNEERAALATLLLSLATTYFTPNQDTPGGIPVKGTVKNNEVGQGAVNLLIYILAAIILIIVIFALLDRL